MNRNPGTGSTSLGVPVCSQTIRMSLAEGHLGSRRSLRVLSYMPIPRCLHLECCRTRGKWTAGERNHVVFSDESRFNLSSDDNRFRVGSPRGEHLNPDFAFKRHNASTASVVVWVSLPAIHGHPKYLSVSHTHYGSPVICP
ncbi:transposable element Tcb2 transposase [Trichonephila clavipes]|nr:transposable element Tcb2 transposase [Trichonephila clavipes]